MKLGMPLDPQWFQLEFPIFTVVEVEQSGDIWAMRVEIDANDCIPLFSTEKQARTYLHESNRSGQTSTLRIEHIETPEKLEHFVSSLSRSTDHAVWNSTKCSDVFLLQSLADLLAAVRAL